MGTYCIFELCIAQQSQDLKADVVRQIDIEHMAVPISLVYHDNNLYVTNNHQQEGVFKYDLHKIDLFLVRNGSDQCGKGHGLAVLYPVEQSSSQMYSLERKVMKLLDTTIQ